MDETEIELFNDSLARCMSGGQFVQRFYELFLASSEEVRDKCSAEVENAWRYMMGAGIAFLKARYDSPIGDG